jgi:hypothetical protein
MSRRKPVPQVIYDPELPTLGADDQTSSAPRRFVVRLKPVTVTNLKYVLVVLQSSTVHEAAVKAMRSMADPTHYKVESVDLIGPEDLLTEGGR